MDAGDDRAVLLDYFSTDLIHPRPSTIFKDLSNLKPCASLETIKVSEAVFCGVRN